MQPTSCLKVRITFSDARLAGETDVDPDILEEGFAKKELQRRQRFGGNDGDSAQMVDVRGQDSWREKTAKCGCCLPGSYLRIDAFVQQLAFVAHFLIVSTRTRTVGYSSLTRT